MAGLDIRDLNESDDLLPIEGYWQMDRFGLAYN